MDSFEAREILASYRPGDTNSPDPRMAAALELARRDPQLAVWFGQHCAAHVKLPGDPGAAAASPVPKPNQPRETAADQIIPLNKPALFIIGVAVLIMLAIVLQSLLVPPPQKSFASYRDRMARLVQRSYPVKIILTDQARMRQYFRTNGGLYDFPLPRNLEKLPGTGAAVFTWNSQPVSLMGLDGGTNLNLYLFLIRQSTFVNEPPPATLQFNRVGRVMTATWAAAGNLYLLTGPNDQATLQSFLASPP